MLTSHAWIRKLRLTTISWFEFFAWAICIFFENGNRRWDTIYRVSDNGTPFMNRFSCLTESYLQVKYGMKTIVLPLCQYHAWSLCDSHGGAVKSNMKRCEIKDEVPDTLDGIKILLETEIERTFVFPQDKIPVATIDCELYARFGGYNKVGPVPGLSDVGHITYLGFGHVLTRKKYGYPDVVEMRCVLPDNGGSHLAFPQSTILRALKIL